MGVKYQMRQSDIVPIEILARQLKVSRAFLHRETKAGRIPYLRAGKQIRYNPSAVRTALAEQATTSGKEVRDE